MIYLDIETTTLQADNSILVTVGLVLPNNEVKMFFVDKPEKEKEVIEHAIETLRDFQEEPIVIWHSGFDIPFLVSRAIKNNLDISDIYNFRIIDLYKYVKENLKLTSYKLDNVCKFLGIEKDDRIVGKDIQSLYLTWLSGDKNSKDAIIEHCTDDLKALKKLFEKLEPYVEKWLRKNWQ